MPFGFWPIYKRELREFLESASTYVVLGLFFLITGAVYHQIIVLFVQQSASAAAGGPFNTPTNAPNVTVDVIQNVFNVMSAMMLFTIPLLSMRLVAAERSSGTFELLATCPVADWGIILGKYFALLSVGAVIVALSSVYPLTTYLLARSAGASPEFPVVGGCFIGLFMIFATYAAFGLMASSLTTSQVTASVITLIGLLIWNTVGEFKIPNHQGQQILGELSASQHTQAFIAGLLSAQDFAFYVLSAAFCLFIAARALEARRWRV